MRILVTGAAGVIGSRLVQNLLSNPDIQLLVCIDQEEISPLIEDNKVHWITKNIQEMTTDEWGDIITTHNISRIYYLECLENLNMFLPTPKIVDRFSLSDNIFLNFLDTLFASTETEKIEVCYISTDKMYLNDDFPNELHPIQIDLTNDENSILSNYVSQKINAELRLLNNHNIEPRIIRPFAVVAPENGTDFPLTSVILRAMFDEDLEIYGNGDQGLVFTDVEDLVSFLQQPELFDPMVGLNLSTKIINFSRVWNYLSEYLLYRKLKDKLGSKSAIIPLTETKTFKYIMQTPQIRNMVRIGIPQTPIEIIIEKIAQTRNPQNTYQPLTVTSVYYTEGPELHIEGTGEPKSGVAVFLGTGEVLNTDVLDNGVWEVAEKYSINQKLTAEIRITSPENIQYQTTVIDIPSSEDWAEPEIQPLVITRINYEYTTGSTPLPYLIISGTCDSSSEITIEIPTGEKIIYLKTQSDEEGIWTAKTLPPFYEMEKGHQGKVRAVYVDGTVIGELSFEIPISPTTAPPPTPPAENNTRPVEVTLVEYRQEAEIPHRTYGYIAGTSEPETLIKLYLPPCADSAGKTMELTTNSDQNGDWSVETEKPWYQRVDAVGRINGYLSNGDLYTLRNFKIPSTDEDLLPPEPRYRDLKVTEFKYIKENTDRGDFTYSFIVQGTGEPGFYIKFSVIDETFETQIDVNGNWFIDTHKYFQDTRRHPMYIGYEPGPLMGTIEMINLGLVLQKVEIEIPKIPLKQPISDMILTVDDVDFISKKLFLIKATYLRLRGRGTPNGKVKLFIPGSIYPESNIPLPQLWVQGGDSVVDVNVDSSGLWEYTTEKAYLNLPSAANTTPSTLIGKAEGYAPDNTLYKTVTFGIPESPKIQ